MDNRTRRTILRKANTSDVNSVTESQFNMYQFTGLNDSNNYATVDQTSFSDANNVYVDTDNELTSRPPVKYTDIFKELLLPSDEIEAIYQSNGTIFYLSDHKLYWKWGDEENCIEDLYAEDEDGTIHYYTRFKIIWINDMYIVFEQYTDTVTHTSLFGLQYIDGKWVRRDVYELLYIPRKDYLTETWLESKNILCDAEIMQYIFDGNDANMENISLRLAGDTFEIEVHDETIEVTWQKHYTDVLITKINSALYEYTFDSHQCTASASAILLYTEGERTGWISRDMGQSWRSITFAPSVDTDAKCTVCLADNADYDTLFVIFNELYSRDADLAPCLPASNYENNATKTYYVTLYKGIFANNDTNDITWYDGKDIVVCDNDTPFSSLKFEDVFEPDVGGSDENGYLYNGMGDKSLFPKESWWTTSRAYGVENEFPSVTGIVSYAGSSLNYGGYNTTRYVKMHAPDGQHCVILFPVYGFIDYIIPCRFHTATETNSDISFDSTYHHAYLDYIRNSKYGYTYILPSPLLINYHCRDDSNGVYRDAENKNMTALVYYNEEKGLYTHSLGVSGENNTFTYTDTEEETQEIHYNSYDATFFEGGRIFYVPVGEGNYEVVFSFNQSGGSYAIISLNGNTATDLRADIDIYKSCVTGSQSYGTGGTQYYFSLNNSIQYRYQTASYEAGTALFYYTREEHIFNTYDDEKGTVDVSFLSIFQPIKNLCDEEDITVTDDAINELFRCNSKSMPKAAGDAFANFQDAMSEIFNIYVNDEGTYINIAVLKDLDINTKLNDLLNAIPDANATFFMRMPQLIEEVEDGASETDKTTRVYIEGDTTSDCISAYSSRTYYYINNLASLKQLSEWNSLFVNHLAYSTPFTTTHRQILAHLFLHSFYDTNVDDWMENGEWTSDKWTQNDRPGKNDLDIGAVGVGYNLFDAHYHTNCIHVHPYMSFNTVEQDITGFSVKTQMLTNVANEVILDKTLSHLFFVTDKYLYNGEYYLFDDPVVDYFWLTDTFEFTPLAILYNTYFIGLNSCDGNNEVYSSYFAYFNETFTVETTTIHQLTIDMPDFDAVAYNSTSLAYNNLLYQTSVGATDEYEDTGYKKLYIPENTKVTLPHNITAMVAFSQTVMGIFTEHTAYEYTYDTDYAYYMLFPTKLTLGNRSGYDITEALSGDRIYFSTVFGFSALAYENFVQSTEQQLTRMDSNIDTIFRDFDKSPIKIVTHNYWTILYRQDSKEILLFDARTSSWWRWTLPFEPDLMYRDGRTLYLFDQDKSTVYQMDFDSEECKDYNGDVIDWSFVSQKLHFGGVTYYKHINNLTVMATPKTNKLRYKLEFKNFHNGYDTDSDITVEYYIETVGNCIKKMNFMKTNAMQFKVALDDTDEYPSKFRMSNISIKYRVTEKIR